jgi:transcriptional regulator with XRE-family HTH domain
MKLAAPIHADAKSVRHDVRMPEPKGTEDAGQDWARVGRYVVARRTDMGFDLRAEFAAHAKITTRVISDLENARRGNYDQVTIAKLEKALGWATGSVDRIAAGGEPRLRDGAGKADHQTLGDLLTTYRPTQDEALVRVMKSDLPDAKKRQIVELLIAERRRAERALLEHAEQLIGFAGED